MKKLLVLVSVVTLLLSMSCLGGGDPPATTANSSPLSDLTKRVVALEQTVGTLSAKTTEVSKADIQAVQASIAAVQSTLATTQASYATLKLQVDGIKVPLLTDYALKTELTALAGKVTTLETSVNSFNAKITNLETTANTLKTDLTALTTKLNDLTTQLNAFKADMNTKLAALDARVAALEARPTATGGANGKDATLFTTEWVATGVKVNVTSSVARTVAFKVTLIPRDDIRADYEAGIEEIVENLNKYRQRNIEVTQGFDFDDDDFTRIVYSFSFVTSTVTLEPNVKMTQTIRMDSVEDFIVLVQMVDTVTFEEVDDGGL